MSRESLVVATHLSDWLAFDGHNLQERTVQWLETTLSQLEEADFDVFNVARAIGYDLSEQNMRQIRPVSQQKIKSCDAFINILQEKGSESLGRDTGFAMGLGKLVLLAHSPDLKLRTFDQLDVEYGYVKEVKMPLNPEEIRDKINTHTSQT